MYNYWLLIHSWRYRTEAELQGTWHWGDIATYGGGGAIQKLARTKAETHEIIDTLKRYNWVEKSTRVVFLDFTVYNANVDIFCIVRLTFEFPATGGVIAIANIDPMHIPQYEDWYEYNIVDPCETLVLLLTIYFVIQEIIEISISGYTGFIREYARNVWVWLDWAIIMVSSKHTTYLSILCLECCLLFLHFTECVCCICCWNLW